MPNPDLQVPNPDLDNVKVRNPDFPAMPKSGLEPTNRCVTRTSHLEVRVKDLQTGA